MTVVNVQALRALAALIVVCIHLPEMFAALGFGFPIGGVDLFFAISGFIMVYTTVSAPPTPVEFLVRRAIRIVPIYWLFTLLTFACVLVAPSMFRSTLASAPNLAWSLLFIPYAQPGGFVRPILFVGWSLNYEIFFYALFAAGLAFRRYGRGLCFVVLVLVALTGAGVLLAPSGPVPVFYTSPLLLEFGLGMAVAVATRVLPVPATRFAAAILGIGFIVALIFTCFSYLIISHSNPLVTTGIPAAGALYCTVMLERLGYGIKIPIARKLGDASYALYLSHPFIVGFIAMAYRKLGGGEVLAIIMIVAALILTAAAALLIHAIVERPLTDWLKRRLRAGPSAASRADPDPRSQAETDPLPERS